MKTLILRPRKISLNILKMLERRGLVKTLTPTKRVTKLKKGESGAVDTIYKSSAAFGAHKLICVGKNETEIALNCHPDNEEIMLIDTSEAVYKPLYLIIALFKRDVLEKKARKGALKANDILALELEYNSPVSVFTILKGAPHCEVTLPGEGMHPVFFVTEPERLEMNGIDMPGYEITLK